ncbi:MAG: hypothetical protein GX434_03290 [Peptococcaceae bacterium]|nr:hypothetical protein [Peptococcaceae bacterium]
MAPEVKHSIPNPKIMISSGHEYKDTGWIGDHIEVKENSVRLSGNMISFEITYESHLILSDYINKVNLTGYDHPLELSLLDGYMGQYKIIFGVARNIEYGKNYTLHISKDLIADQNGNMLENDLDINILIEEDPKASYSLIGYEKTYTGLGQMESDPQSVHQTLFLTTEPKTFEIDFTKDVNKERVEQSIKNGLGDKAEVGYEWINSHKLKIYVDKLMDNTEYLLSMKDAVDQKGSKIIGNLFFRVNDPNQLSVMDLKTKTAKVIRQFRDKSFNIWPTSEIHNLLLLDNSQEKTVYHIKNGNTIPLKNKSYGLGMPGFDWYLNWIDPETVLYKEVLENSTNIFTENLVNGRKTKLFEFPYSTFHVYDAKLSPDKKKIVFTTDDHSADISISVYSIDGKKLYEGKNIASGQTRQSFPTTIYIQWMDDENLVFIDKEDVVKLDLTTGKKELLLKNATKPVTLHGIGLVLAQKKDPSNSGSVLLTEKGVKEVLTGDEISNCNFISKEKLVFNIGEDIYLYDIEKDQKEKMEQQGFILGLTPDKDAVYYLTNYNNIYWYLEW